MSVLCVCVKRTPICSYLNLNHSYMYLVLNVMKLMTTGHTIITNHSCSYIKEKTKLSITTMMPLDTLEWLLQTENMQILHCNNYFVTWNVTCVGVTKGVTK